MMLKQAFPEWKSNGGIFFALEQNPGTPWRGAVDALSLDLDYYGNRSGSKIVSSLVKAMCEDGVLSPDSITALAALLIAKYGLSWSRMWEAVTKEYDPLNNYDMKEVFDEDGTRAGSSTSSDAQNIFGFNSSEASPANSSSMQGSVSETTGTNHTLTRSGNIGVTTSAQMLQGEIDVRMRSFFEIVYTNIDEVLSIPVYGCAEDEETTGGSSTYKLPVAGPSVLGGVMPLAKTDAMTQPVGVDGVGRLYVQPSEADVPVTSVNGKTGAVTLNYDDVGAPSLDEFQQIEDDVEMNTSAINAVSARVDSCYSSDNPPPYPVTSVNGQTGDVTISAGGCTYLQDEVDTGDIWIDGSHIYRRTFVGTSLSAQEVALTNSGDIDILINSYGYIQYVGYQMFMAVNSYGAAAGQASQVLVFNGNIRVQTGTSARGKYAITVEYTKKGG